MKAHFTGLAVALLLTVASTLPGHAEEAAQPSTPAASPSAPAATPEAPPPTTAPRPSIMPKNAEPAQQPIAPQADDDAALRRHRHYAHRRYGWHYAYWQPFPIYWPHLYHNRFYWSRMPWFF